MAATPLPPRDGNCIFCKIVDGILPCHKIHEDEHTIAFMDIFPLSPGHALVIPKDHHPDLYSMPDDLLGPVMRTTRRVALAMAKGQGPDGMNLFQANGVAAGQTVFHFHMHILPRRTGDGVISAEHGKRPGDHAMLAREAEMLRGILAEL
ncbi:HIT family protein [Zavarzinia compransoris]|uniref:HIT family protein n=1 Tax=Zavarzinia compransoris TaxID=1264899 RepID=A0A317DYR9_9PROT|nr:HIT family protein [Zavarzinia compransoris]PWR19829.1 HIT family protein [Zavarzinia compransoris]TDP45064.1 histidine triad (HIT) family protein [Zavarzinia compransoris]